MLNYYSQSEGATIGGPVETIFGTSRWPDGAHARVPSAAASGNAWPCRLDG